MYYTSTFSLVIRSTLDVRIHVLLFHNQFKKIITFSTAFCFFFCEHYPNPQTYKDVTTPTHTIYQEHFVRVVWFSYTELLCHTEIAWNIIFMLKYLCLMRVILLRPFNIVRRKFDKFGNVVLTFGRIFDVCITPRCLYSMQLLANTEYIATVDFWKH